MFRLKIKRYEEQLKILLMIILLSISCYLTYYFLVILKISIIFYHFFYLPTIFACIWWRRKGLVVPIFLSGLLIISGILLGLDTIYIDNLIRGLILLFIGIIVTFFCERISKDITERKKVEQKLKESEEKYQIITKYANDIIFILDNNFKFEFVSNQSLFKILGYSSNEVIDQKPIKLIHPDDHEKALKEFKKILEGIGGTVEVRVRHKDGHYIWTESDGNVFIDKKGEPKLLVILRDVTEKREAEQKLKESEEKLRKLNKELEQRIEERTKKLKESEKRYRNFTSIASHEFKTPLIPIIGIPQLLVKDNNLTEQQKDSLNEILHSGKKLNKLINNLLDISQIERKSVKLSKKEIEINTLINWCISDLSFLIKQKNQTLTKNLQEDIKLNIDDKKISRVLTNLISNAIKYTPSNGRIEISTQIDEENNFIFSIKDNGIGIEKKDQELIFQKFGKIRGEEIVKYELDSHGSGLGLFISKEIIELHGGEMWFESAGKNNGTTFYFKLPRK